MKFADMACAMITVDRTRLDPELWPACAIGMTCRDLCRIPIGIWKGPLPGTGTRSGIARLELDGVALVPGIICAL